MAHSRSTSEDAGERNGSSSARARSTPQRPPPETIFTYQVLDCYQELYDFAQHRGHPLIIVNVASRCKDSAQQGFSILTELNHRYHDRGLGIVAFPCNQFGAAEPGNAEEVAQTVARLYPQLEPITFPIMAKVDVNGDHEAPLYSFLKRSVKGVVGQGAVVWNFVFFVVDASGMPVARFGPDATLEDLAEVVESLLDGERTAAPSVSDGHSKASNPRASSSSFGRSDAFSAVAYSTSGVLNSTALTAEGASADFDEALRSDS